jgi:hypothetical protein
MIGLVSDQYAVAVEDDDLDCAHIGARELSLTASGEHAQERRGAPPTRGRRTSASASRPMTAVRRTRRVPAERYRGFSARSPRCRRGRGLGALNA